jgi:hypothetical protein
MLHSAGLFSFFCQLFQANLDKVRTGRSRGNPVRSKSWLYAVRQLTSAIHNFGIFTGRNTHRC